MKLKIGVIGDYDAAKDSHQMLQTGLNHSGSCVGTDVEAVWLPTEELEREEIDLTRFDGLWGAPGSPYNSLVGALKGIRFARENHVPFLGTCGGCQHAILEIARTMRGFEDAQHAESDPYASKLFISKLVCSLAGKEIQLELKPGSRAMALYGGARNVTERYYCNFGLARKHESVLENAGLKITGSDVTEEAQKNETDSPGRIFEIVGHPFFVATLFVPQMRSTSESPHPLITGFVRASQLVSEKV